MQFGSLCFETAEPLGRMGLNGELMSSHVGIVLEIVILDSKTAAHQINPTKEFERFNVVFPV